MVRVAVVDREYCKPNKCNLECIRFCPVNKTKHKKAIELSPDGKHAVIYEDICIGCGICVKKCPFNAISIVNLPDELEKNVVHRYGENMFKLYNLPIPRLGNIMGIIGRNGSGKTTSIKILSGLLKPNLGQVGADLEWDDIIRRFRGTELQTYFAKLANNEIKPIVKIQYVELVKRRLKGRVGELLKKADERGIVREVVDKLAIKHILDRKTSELSGGELQKFLVAAVLVKDADAYFFDEPCSYLDVKERLRVAQAIREFIDVSKKYIMVVEHDLMILDYISDQVSIIYGEPGVYGIVSKPYGVRTGINHYLEGYLPAENMRIRREPIHFRIQVDTRVKPETEYPILKWTNIVKTYRTSGFKLFIEAGEAYPGEVLGIIGPNGIGKTTFIKLLGGILEPDEGEVLVSVETISFKPQELSPKIFPEETVAANLRRASPSTLNPASWIYAELIRKLGLNKMLDRYVADLSGGELQKLAVAVALAKQADLYLLDEPSAYLDVEERLSVAKVIRRIIEEKRKTAMIVEHDLMLQNFVSDEVIVFSGKPGVEGYASKPMSNREGFNKLLRELGITVRRDPQSGRPRVNKPGSYLDRQQKSIGQYYMP
ncbi:ribosome biogenesis/translation initiation ATPase RLI [Staphylothermus hellenicus]|uniref:ABC transporter related protein n=1 Tax=Staphylothermus hellenicus (strain DSM 12710 / JCM 10830 / BK20S6-10-b1 / P8) TaxID=591019 RepID=D7DA56_STAHD|nr:ribosome biogenesis/translation initiation ATPase RLI [Staphylothermus hellenicus]ADI32652.1 ABC transporter related protein [Staphylothermus hellenicus DSM 12710]